MARDNVLATDGHIISDLWVDQDDAIDVLAKRSKLGEIDDEMSGALKDFIEKGYAVIDLDLPAEFCESAIQNVEQTFDRRPKDLLAAQMGLNGGRPMPLSEFDSDFTRGPGFRFLDSHSHVSEFTDLMAHDKLHKFVQLVLEQPCVASQSLHFSYGSAQALHRDPWFVVTTPIANMLAAWIALEDIDPDSGPLSFVPGSHKLPYKPLATGDIIFHDPSVSDEDRAAHRGHMTETMEAHGLKTEVFTAKRGQALLWHSSLVHGGSVVRDPSKTRRSFVIHYDALKNHKSHAQRVKLGGAEPTVVRTTRVVERDGRRWFPNPLVEHYKETQ